MKKTLATTLALSMGALSVTVQAAPPAYPASYINVIAVTGVDRRNRAMIGAGRALHLDYSAPGADVYGLDAKGKRKKLRGTSFATPLVAARIAFAIAKGGSWRRTVNSEAVDLGKRGPDSVFWKRPALRQLRAALKIILKRMD